MTNSNPFKFNISLSVLNHLGRGLYRNFITVLGEAISNSWDADANNVWININRQDHSFIVKDDGIGMDADDFQNKFLKIGYSKRAEGNKTPSGRPYIGRKGIGKLAMLSCAATVTVISKSQKSSAEYIGGIIHNSQLEEAIKADRTSEEYSLKTISDDTLGEHRKDHSHGTIIGFDQFNEGVRNSIEYLRKTIALYFRFSLLDSKFKIFLDGDEVTIEDLTELSDNTEFLWMVGEFEDDFTKSLRKLKNQRDIPNDLGMAGFIATVEKPSNLAIFGAGEKIGIDLFVNGRLRETNILRHKSSHSTSHFARYIYGQIHFDGLDDSEDRFNSSRDGIRAEDPKFAKLLRALDTMLRQVAKDWDSWRIESRQTGDADNEKPERKATELFNVVLNRDYPNISTGKVTDDEPNVANWVKQIDQEAEFNFPSYAECFISENLVRQYIKHRRIVLTPEIKDEVESCRAREKSAKNIANVSIPVRKENDDLSYLGMQHLAKLADRMKTEKANLESDAKVYKPFRNAVAHTALLTDEAKDRLTSVYNNIKGRINTILSQ